MGFLTTFDFSTLAFGKLKHTLRESVQIRSYFWSVIPVFGLKIRTRSNSVFGHSKIFIDKYLHITNVINMAYSLETLEV